MATRQDRGSRPTGETVFSVSCPAWLPTVGILRCLKCPRVNGVSPAAGRVLMSARSQQLSFGKFLELSISNHGVVDSLANCKHSLHHDCLRFYRSTRPLFDFLAVLCFCNEGVLIHAVPEVS